MRLKGEAEVPFTASEAIVPWSQERGSLWGLVFAAMFLHLEDFLEYYPLQCMEGEKGKKGVFSFQCFLNYPFIITVFPSKHQHDKLYVSLKV